MALTYTQQHLIDYARRAMHSGSGDNIATDRVTDAIEAALKMLGEDRNWSFHQDTVDVVTIAPYETGTVAVTNGATAVVGTGTTFPTNSVGQRIEFDGQRHWSEPTVRTDATNLTLLQAYTDPAGANLSGDTYKILYVFYDLPANFGKLQEIKDIFGDKGLEDKSFSGIHLLHSERAGAGDPEQFAIVEKRNDPNQIQLFLYPPPSSAKVYQLIYYRRPGWFDTATPATSTWKRKATATTDYVDWKDDYLNILQLAIRAKVALELKPEAADQYQRDYEIELAKVGAQEKKTPRPRLFGRGSSAPSGEAWSF